MRNILITGANRGLGLEFTRQCLQRGDQVFATARQPDKSPGLRELQAAHPEALVVIPLDLTEAESLESCHAQVRDKVDSLHWLINNAGLNALNPDAGGAVPVSRLGQLDTQALLHLFQVNAVAPLLLAQRFLDLLKAAHGARIVNISTNQSSLTAKISGGQYGYCGSKAALNMLMRTLAYDVLPFGIISVLINPGWVKTDMGGASAPLTAEQSVSSMLRHIEALKDQDAGHFFNWDGAELPW
jgi:NAD(P)-dependent dehydrogenase (short-subunit alcohol dehydrogenase family)